MLSYKKLKQNSTSLDNMVKQIEDKNKSSFEKDPLDWYPSVDMSGNGRAIVRLLPECAPDDIAWVNWKSHSFKDKNTGEFYIENSLWTFKEKDLIGDYNGKLYNTNKENDKTPERALYKHQNRRDNFRCNIYIIEDFNKPENNGQVRKFPFGKQIWDKIEAKLDPKEVAGRKPKRQNPFDLEEGMNLVIDIFSKKVAGMDPQRDYTNSYFEAPGPLFDDEEKIEAIYAQIAGNPAEWSLKKYTDRSDKTRWKTREELDARLIKVLGFDPTNWKSGMPLMGSGEPIRSASSEPKQFKSVEAPVQKEADSKFIDNVTDDEIPF